MDEVVLSERLEALSKLLEEEASHLLADAAKAAQVLAQVPTAAELEHQVDAARLLGGVEWSGVGATGVVHCVLCSDMGRR